MSYQPEVGAKDRQQMDIVKIKRCNQDRNQECLKSANINLRISEDDHPNKREADHKEE
jgi:hypothetical protein